MLLGLRRRPRGLFRRASRLRPVRCAATLVTDPEDERLALYSMKSVRRFKQYESQRRRLLSEYPEYNVAVHSSRKVVEKLVDHWQTAPEDVVIHSFLTSAALYDQISHFVHRPGVPVFVVDKEMVDEVVGLRHRRQNAHALQQATCTSASTPVRRTCSGTSPSGATRASRFLRRMKPGTSLCSRRLRQAVPVVSGFWWSGLSAGVSAALH
mmetsp:Transcript_119833/g.274526  ORF Transcript_119833/g.274526 Transcript_119833/m.274526 type:complete len:210 (+) Transcript_119833:60-689(+)